MGVRARWFGSLGTMGGWFDCGWSLVRVMVGMSLNSSAELLGALDAQCKQFRPSLRKGKFTNFLQVYREISYFYYFEIDRFTIPRCELQRIFLLPRRIERGVDWRLGLRLRLQAQVFFLLKNIRHIHFWTEFDSHEVKQ